MIVKALFPSLCRTILMVSIQRSSVTLSGQGAAVVAEKGPYQSDTVDFYLADFAIDGDPHTCAISCNRCKNYTGHGYGHGWWQFDFGREQTVFIVEIHACRNDHFADSLVDITIGVTSQNTSDFSQILICKELHKEILPEMEWSKIECLRVLTGRYLIIIRSRGATFKPESLALGEIRVYDKDKNQHSITAAPPALAKEEDVLKQLKDGKWRTLSLEGMVSEQIGTYQKRLSRNAMDGNPMTVAYAYNEDERSTIPAWWKVNLVQPYSIAAAEVVTSSQVLESNLLQEFSIEIWMDNKKAGVCLEVTRLTEIPPDFTLVLPCANTLKGNIFKIAKSPRARYRPKALVIAEVLIFGLV